MKASTLTRVARYAGWLLLALVAVVTIGPIEVRPETVLGPDVERFLAYFVSAFLLAFGYPGRKMTVAIVVIAAAIGFEIAQHFVPTRDARVIDSLIKIGGAVCGIAVEAFLARVFRLSGQKAAGSSDV